MPSPILYLVLSLSTGAAYALLANGIVAIYKGSGVLNFAQGASRCSPRTASGRSSITTASRST